jgi:hypothetical protein
VNVLDEIRPRAEHLTDAHSRVLLDSVLSSAPPRRKRRWNRVAAFGLCGAIVAGGTAYATGLVPGIVSDRFQQIRSGEDGWPDPIHYERLIADVPMSNGVHARVWYADTVDGRCAIRDMTGTVTRPEDFGVGCARWGPGEEHDPRRGVHWQTSAGGPAVVYGDFTGVAVHVAHVEVSGPGWTRSFRVEDADFAGEVPAGADGDRIRFRYLDPSGGQLATKTVTVAIESE